MWRLALYYRFFPEEFGENSKTSIWPASEKTVEAEFSPAGRSAYHPSAMLEDCMLMRHKTQIAFLRSLKLYFFRERLSK
jgi:hypothetical protein